MPTSVTCPKCKTSTQWENNEHRPFCSARCKNTDFIAWANEEYQIGNKASTEDSPFSEELAAPSQNRVS